MCTDIDNYVPVRPWFDDENEEEQWGCGYGGDVIAHSKQNFYNKICSLQDQDKDDGIDTLQKRNKIWLNNISTGEGLIPDNLYDYDYNNEGRDHSVREAKIFPEIAELKNFLDIIRCKCFRNQFIFLETK